MKQTLENIAAIHLKLAADQMDCAAYALAELPSAEAKQHAKEMRGAAKMARQWARDVVKQAREAM